MARQNGKDAVPTEWRRQAREVADSLAIAFILAMVIRHYVLEVFKIPTKSMQPTLLGDPVTGDKILVNKFAYDFREPRRWDVIVFKFPEDTSRNYIKRLIGLPGETVRVQYGDIFINGQIARKPWRVQRALWRRRRFGPEIPPARAPSDRDSLWLEAANARGAEPWLPDDPSLWHLGDHEFTVDCQGSPVVQYAAYLREILAYEERDFRESRRPFENIPTSDIMLQFQLVPHRLAGTAHVVFDIETARSLNELVDQWNVRFPLDGSSCRVEVYRSGDLVATGEPFPLRAGRPLLVQVCNVDRALLVRVGGVEVARHEYEPSQRSYEIPGFHSRARVRIGCKDGRVTFRRPSLFADVYYTENPDRNAVREPYTLGPGEYFVMGDNSANSNDSRQWGPVPRRYLVGEAFLILWPLARMGLVR